jgi:hypothetical protein
MSDASWWVIKSHDANVGNPFMKPRLVDLGIFPFGLLSLEHGLTGLGPVAYCGDEWLGCLANQCYILVLFTEIRIYRR